MEMFVEEVELSSQTFEPWVVCMDNEMFHDVGAVLDSKFNAPKKAKLYGALPFCGPQYLSLNE